MLKFRSKEFEEEVIDCLTYVREKETGGGLRLDFPNILCEYYNSEDYEDELIDENYEISIYPDEGNQRFNMTIREFIDMINESKEIIYNDTLKCITDKRALTRVKNSDKDYNHRLNALLDLDDRILEKKSTLNNKEFTCSITKGFTLYGLMRHFKKDYHSHYGSVVDTDIFIKIKYDEKFSEEELEKIYNAYIFELSASHDINMIKDPRYSILDIDESKIELEKAEEIPIRPLVFGKGVNPLLEMFNRAKANNMDYEYSIIQYMKVLEYVSQTVVREELNREVFIKLESPKALNPDPDYVKELKSLITGLNKNYQSQREALKATVKTCCDVFDIIEYAPDYLDKVKNLKEDIENNRSNKRKLMEAAYNQLVDSICHTKEYLSQVKINYQYKGSECSEEDLACFSRMMKRLATQGIKWFVRVDENSRVL